MFERITHMLIKEFIQILRDPRMRTVIFVMPLVQTLVFGYAVTTDVTHIPTAIFDLDNSRASRELVARFTGSGYFDVVAYVDREEEARDLVDHGAVKAVLQMNKGFGDDLRAGRTAPVQVIGLVAATLATNQAQVSLMTILVVAPMINLSGTWTPPEAMPGWLSVLMLLSPLHHFVNISYGIQLKGVGLDILWPSVSAMVLLGGSLFGFGIWRFRRQFA